MFSRLRRFVQNITGVLVGAIACHVQKLVNSNARYGHALPLRMLTKFSIPEFGE
jgi:hypothetical protein